MKGKFRKILGVGLALALVLSLSLVGAVPVSAAVSQPQVTVTPNNASAPAAYTIAFNTNSDLAIGDTITIDFTEAGDTAVGTLITQATVFVNGTACSDPGVTGKKLVIALAAAVNAGAVEVFIDKGANADYSITNPTSAGSYRLKVNTSVGDTNPVFSAYYTIGAAVATPTVVSALPKYGVRDSTLDVVITGTKLTGATAVSFGVGITTNSFTVDSATKITANITISAVAPLGAHTVAVTIAGSSYTGSNIFYVEAGPALVKMYDAAGKYYGATKTIAAALGYAEDNYTVEVTAGTYTPEGSLMVKKKGLTLKSTDGAASTIIKGTTTEDAIVKIGAADVTIDGFTFDATAVGSCEKGIAEGETGFTIKNNKFIGLQGANIILDSAGGAFTSGTIDNNTFIGTGETYTYPDCAGITLGSGNSCDITGVTISNNTLSKFKGGNAITLSVSDGTTMSGITVTGNTVTDSAGYGLVLQAQWPGGANTIDNIDVTDNTFSGCLTGIRTYEAMGTLTVTNLTITGNDITDNTKEGILVETWTAASDVIKFNNITGNTLYGIKNTTTVNVNATHNWWGTTVASEIAGMINDTSSGVTAYDPWLGASVSAAKGATDSATLDAKTAVGVVVSGAAPGADVATDVIAAARYTSNPKPDATLPFTPIENGFFDVYVYEATTAWIDADEVVLKFYDSAITSDSVVYTWDSTEDAWKECTLQGYSSAGGAHMWVKVHTELNTTDPTTPAIEALVDLPFAIGGVAEEFDPMDYDADGDGVIQKTEALTAVADYFDGVITKAEALEVIALYFG